MKKISKVLMWIVGIIIGLAVLLFFFGNIGDKWIMLGLFVLYVAACVRAVKHPKKNTKEYTFKVAGISFYLNAVRKLVNDDGEYDGKCQLLKEPDNPVDPEALAVYTDGEMVGHIAHNDRPTVEALLTKAVKTTIHLNYTDIFFGRVTIYIEE